MTVKERYKCKQHYKKTSVWYVTILMHNVVNMCVWDAMYMSKLEFDQNTTTLLGLVFQVVRSKCGRPAVQICN